MGKFFALAYLRRKHGLHFTRNIWLAIGCDQLKKF
jgi:hypothetical protein